MNCLAFLIFAIIVENKINAQDGDYCAVKCSNGKHTACIDDKNQCDLTCDKSNDGFVQLDHEQRLAILYLHNQLREKVASGKEQQGELKDVNVSNMEILSWNHEAEYIASCLAKRCNFAHDGCRNLLNGTYCGQNLAYMGSSDSKIKEQWKKPKGFNRLINSWYAEVKDCEADIYDNFKKTEAMTGHFTAMIWAKTNRIGCAYISYIEKNMYKVILVCNYWPGGNVISLPIFERGKIRPDCGKDSEFPHLCGVQIPLKGNIAFFSAQPFAIMIVIYTFKFLL